MFREINFVLTFIRDFITGNDLVSKYTQLAANYQKVQETGTAGSDDTLKEEIENLQKQIFDIYNSVNLEIWTAPKKSVLERMKATEFIGPGATSYLKGILNDSIGNPSKISQGITAFKNATSELLARANQTITLLGLEGFTEELAEDKQLLEISFEEGSSLKNFWEMEKSAEDWSYIIKTFTRLTGQDYESVGILSQATASPSLGIALSLVPKTAQAIIQAVNFAVALKTIKDMFLKKKKKAEEVDMPKQDTLKIVIKDLVDERDGEYKKKLGEFSLEITKTCINKKNGENDNELNNAVSIALDKLANMLAYGTKVVNPQEISAIPVETETLLGKSYSENKILSNEVKELMATEMHKMLEAKHKQMVKEVEVVVTKRGRGRPPKSKSTVEQTEKEVSTVKVKVPNKTVESKDVKVEKR